MPPDRSPAHSVYHDKQHDKQPYRRGQQVAIRQTPARRRSETGPCESSVEGFTGAGSDVTWRARIRESRACPMRLRACDGCPRLAFRCQRARAPAPRLPRVARQRSRPARRAVGNGRWRRSYRAGWIAGACEDAARGGRSSLGAPGLILAATSRRGACRRRRTHAREQDTCARQSVIVSGTVGLEPGTPRFSVVSPCTRSSGFAGILIVLRLSVRPDSPGLCVRFPDERPTAWVVGLFAAGGTHHRGARELPLLR